MSEALVVTGGSVPSYQLHIGGHWCEPSVDSVINVFSPAHGGHLAIVPKGEASEVDMAVRAADEAFEAWSALDPFDRARHLHAFAVAIRQHMEELVELETAIIGRPIREMRAQLSRVPEWLEYFASIAIGLEAEANNVKGGYVTINRYEPLGVCGMLTPWNHPVLILVKKLSAALAAGNTCVVKPSSQAPVTPLLLSSWAAESGLPGGVFNVVTGGPVAGTALCDHPLVSRIDLTGGTETGRHVASRAAERLIPCSLELGGKAPVVIFGDTPLEEAAAGAVFSAFVAAGQSCVSGTRFIVEESIYEEFLALFVERAKAIQLGDPVDPETEMGPVISAGSLERCLEAIAEARAAGARCVAGGGQPEMPAPFDKGHYIEPTIFADVSPDMALFRTEIFGPVVSVTPFKTEEDALTIANDSEYALGASLWTRDITRALRVANRLRSGVMWINDHHKNDPRSIWGGFGASGYGKENSWDALRSYMRKRSIVVRTEPDFDDWFGGGTRYG
jgi:acyl-CoA reductase-like NAD-dependent aldehyde dehydrogenase